MNKSLNNKKRINILFVCHGNICRSPMAEFVFKKIIKDNNLEDNFYVESASTSTDEIGNPIYFESQKQLIKHGITNFLDKRARQVVKEDYDKFDYIFLMDNENISGIRKIINDDKKNKIHKLLSFVSDDCDKRYKEIIGQLPENGIAAESSDGSTVYMQIHYAMKSVKINELTDLDYIINQTVNAKNHAKKVKLQKANQFADMSKEDIAKCKIVEKLLNEKMLSFHFQPIVSAHDGHIFGYEALMRDETEAKLSPFDILKGAAKLERMYDIEKATFNGVLNRIEEGKEEFAGKKVFINSLPAYQLVGADAAKLLSRLNEHRGNVVVEYTEDSEVDEDLIDVNRAVYSALHVDIALDDYGSGYSNTNNLLRYEPRYVKIDRSLITGIDTNPQKRYFVKSIIDYSKDNNILVLAEGVETVEELRSVVMLGVDLIQGFYTGRPSRNPLQEIAEEVAGQIKRFVHQKDSLELFG